MRLKYNDKVIVIKDEENDGFYVGLEGKIIDKMKFDDGRISYQVDDGKMYPKFFKEDQLQKI